MKGLEEIRAVAFDVGGTLVEPWPSVGHVYAEVGATHGLTGLDPVTLNQRFAGAWKRRGSFDYTQESWLEIVCETFEEHTEASESARFFPVLYERFACARAWRIFPDVLPTLQWLRGLGVPLAIISNWDDRLRGLLAGLGLDRYFEVQIISGEIGIHKPAPEIFERAVAELELPPGAVLHVGDSALEDVEGARRAGLNSLLLNRGQSRVAADGIESLDELRGLGLRHR